MLLFGLGEGESVGGIFVGLGSFIGGGEGILDGIGAGDIPPVGGRNGFTGVVGSAGGGGGCGPG